MKYRKGKWSEERVRKFIKIKHRLYRSIKEDGLLDPIIINTTNRVVDGNHRLAMLEHLGYDSVLVRRTI